MGIYDRRFLVHEIFALGIESKVDEIRKLAPHLCLQPTLRKQARFFEKKIEFLGIKKPWFFKRKLEILRIKKHVRFFV
jgi:hypothetical protein